MLALIERLKHSGEGAAPENIPIRLVADLVARESI
jgi:hypothetical protein